jgi:hypothetical protein
MPRRARSLSHLDNNGESMGCPGDNCAKQSQFVETLVDCNRLSIKRLGRKETYGPRAKTKPTPVVEIASSACGLFAMTTCGAGLLSGRRRRENVQNKANFGRARMSTKCLMEKELCQDHPENRPAKTKPIWRRAAGTTDEARILTLWLRGRA